MPDIVFMIILNSDFKYTAMENDWILIYSVGKLYQAELLKERLEEEGIMCDIINKKDSSFQFGDIDLFVNAKDEARAREIVRLFNI